MNNFTQIAYKLSLLVFISIYFLGCSEDGNSSGDSEDFSQTELQTVLETDKIAGTVDSVLAEIFLTNSVMDKSFASSNNCYSVENSQTGFVVNFNNCRLNGTNNINGKLTVVYAIVDETAAFTATYTDFYVGTLKVNGTRNYKLTSTLDENRISFTVISDMLVADESGAVISESGTKTFDFTFGDTLATSVFDFSGIWQVEANGNTYVVETVDNLKGTLNCRHLISGSFDINKNGFIINVDFGDGECDNLATITSPNGNSQEVTF